MKETLYTVYDIVACEGGPLFTARNDAVAIRLFKNLMKQQQLNSHDFRLYACGEYDNEHLQLHHIEKREVFSPGSSLEQEQADMIGAGG